MSLLPQLLDILDLKEIEEGVFEGQSLDIGSLSVYGGQVVAQAIVAMNRTIDPERRLHSLHAYFLRRGKIGDPIHYHVEATRDGRSFSVRRVKAQQNDKVIFIVGASFHIEEEGFEHQMNMPNVTRAEDLNSFSTFFEQFADQFDIKARGLYSDNSPIIFHPVEVFNPFKPGIRPPYSHIWFKANGELTGSQALQQSVVAYASDFNLLITSFLPHNVSLFSTPMQLASLDHSMWFHKPLKADEWMLYVVHSPNAGGARGFCTGRIFSKEGDLLVSVTQEGLIRLKGEKKAI
jgi:acyl-CoA thioesterase-2